MNSNMIKIHCTDNNKIVDAKIINQTDSWLVVLIQPGDIKLTMKRVKPDLFVGQIQRYEFTYKLNKL